MSTTRVQKLHHTAICQKFILISSKTLQRIHAINATAHISYASQNPMATKPILITFKILILPSAAPVRLPKQTMLQVGRCVYPAGPLQI